jgi:hypothetical protein
MSLPLVFEQIFNAQPVNASAAGALGTLSNSRLLEDSKSKARQDTKSTWAAIDIEAKKMLILRLTKQVVELEGKPVTHKEIKKEMGEKGEEASVEEGSVGSVEPAKKQRKEDRVQQKVSNLFPKLAAHADTTFLGTIIAVSVGASKKRQD